MFCCSGFEGLISHAGERGISALVNTTPDGARFKLQARAVSRGIETFLSENPTPLPAAFGTNVALVANMVLNYCPYCGTRLNSLITPSNRQEFQALAEKHSKIDDFPR
jgi:hypothetical protein